MNRPAQTEPWQQLADDLAECFRLGIVGTGAWDGQLKSFQDLSDEDRWRTVILLARKGYGEAVLRDWGLEWEREMGTASALIRRLRSENVDILLLVNQDIPLAVKGLLIQDDVPHRRKVLDSLLKLELVDRHYTLIEDVVFPNLRPAPPMGAVLAVRGTYQDIRRMLRDSRRAIEDPDREYAELFPFVDFMVRCAREAVQREDTVLMGLVERSEGVDWNSLLEAWNEAGS